MKATAKDGTVLPDELLEATMSYNGSRHRRLREREQGDLLAPAMRERHQDQYEARQRIPKQKFGQRPVTRNTTMAVVSDKKINYNEYPRPV